MLIRPVQLLPWFLRLLLPLLLLLEPRQVRWRLWELRRPLLILKSPQLLPLLLPIPVPCLGRCLLQPLSLLIPLKPTPLLMLPLSLLPALVRPHAAPRHHPR